MSSSSILSESETGPITGSISAKNDWEQKSWAVVNSMFEDRKKLVSHQLDSFNHFITTNIPAIVKENSPITVPVPSSFDETKQRYMLEYQVRFGDIYLSKPAIVENDGQVKPMYPNDARMRNLTYSSPLYIDVEQSFMRFNPKTEEMETEDLPSLKKIQIGKIPIMVGSNYCILSEITNESRDELGEGMYDEGGYFIVSGGEKVIISSEKKCENRVFIFPVQGVLNTQYRHIAEIVSVNTDNGYSHKHMKILMKVHRDDNLSNTSIRVSLSRFKTEIPLFVIFRALGIIADKNIIEMILYNLDQDNIQHYFELLYKSIHEANAIQTKEAALEFLSSFHSIPVKSKMLNTFKLKYTEDALLQELLPHVGKSPIKKAYYLGMAVNKLLRRALGIIGDDDRDSFVNKRIETPGMLLTLLFRANFNKMVKDMKRFIEGDIRLGKVDDLPNTLIKKIRGNEIETAIKRALSTGSWVVSKILASRKGVAQALNRYNYFSSLSHLRRITAPSDRNSGGKIKLPRYLHGTHWGMLCVTETPEGGNIGLVRNIALSASITTNSNPKVVIDLLFENGVISLEEIAPLEVYQYPKVFVNGDWIGIHREPHILVPQLLEYRRSGVINIYNSISWDIQQNEIYIYTDEGRLTRPLYIVEDNQLRITDDIITGLREKRIDWNDLLINDLSPIKKAVIEYIDNQETDTIMIAMDHRTLRENQKKVEDFLRYTHSEIHPSLMYGALGCTIPFSNFNKAHRNLLQGAMGKQAMGVADTNFNQRMDALSVVLHYPQKPIVDTNLSKYVHGIDIPCGQNPIIAIACFTGYNQEDSIIVNQSSLDRGLFVASTYKTYRDEERKNQSTLDDEKFCKPEIYNPDGTIKTSGMKFGNYSLLDENGFVRIGSYVQENDVIIGKVIPVRQENEKDPKYKSSSMTIKQNESGYVDWVYINRNGDGYRFCKVRVRTERIPVIGDKFSNRHGQKATIGIVIPQEDMPYTRDGIVPDIIINPNGITSRQALGQLVEGLFGKFGCLKACEVDSTPYRDINVDELSQMLEEYTGYHRSGNEVMYNGKTGEMIHTSIFLSIVFYYRLKHMVDDKMHSRDHGPMQLLTKQPSEGRARDGGLRFGEMERDCMLGHGTIQFLKERMFDNSDKYLFYVCKECGAIANVNRRAFIYKCPYCDNTSHFAQVQVPYASKLFIQELMSMSIIPRLFTTSKSK
jgi:DNA-directed RNA polymerase II subunit RPB2